MSPLLTILCFVGGTFVGSFVGAVAFLMTALLRRKQR